MTQPASFNPMPSPLTRAEFLRASACGLGALALTALSSSLRGADNPMLSAIASPNPAASGGKSIDLRDFVRWITDEFEPSVRLSGGAGHYGRSPGQTEPEIYGIADMACVLHTIRRLRPTEKERTEWAAAFQEFQNPDTGWLVERDPTHTPLHNTAFALAAMELLDLRPKYPVRMGAEYADMRTFLETIDWHAGVYLGSHKGAGLGSIYTLVPELGTPAWFADYFAYCDSLVDPRNGLMGRGKPPGGDFDQVGGSFHYFFIYSYFNRQMPFPEQRIDAVLGLQQPDGYWNADNHLWLTLDAIYLMTRSLRQLPHRFADVQASVRRALQAVQRDFWSAEGRQKAFRAKMATHSLTAAISIAAEAQQFLGANEIVTDEPLKLVLDRRPFI